MKKAHKKLVDEVEHQEGEPFVYLKKGYKLPTGEHCFGARTDADMVTQLDEVESCNCDSCTN